MTKKQHLLEIIQRTAIIRAGAEKIVTSKGQPAGWLLDLRRTFMDGASLQLCADLFWEECAHQLPFQIGGLEAGSIPLVAAIILEGKRRGTPVNGFFIRKERKSIGRQQRLEGILTDAPIMIVDDLLNAGGTVKKIITALAELRRKPHALFTIVDYGNPHGHTYLKKEHIATTTLYTLQAIGLQRSKPALPPHEIAHRKLWRFRTPEPNYFHVVPKSVPVLDATKMYFGADNACFYALNQKTGDIVWRYQTGRDREGKGIFSTPAIHDRCVYFGSYDGSLYALTTKDGARKWRAELADWIGSSPVIAPGLNRLFIGLEYARKQQRGGLAAVDLATGNRLFEYPTREVLHGSPIYVATHNLVITGTNDGDLIAINATTGQCMWKVTTQGPIRARPAISLTYNLVICGSHDGTIYIVDLLTGKRIWSISTESFVYSTPLIRGSRAYISCADKHLYVLDLKDQRVLAKIPVRGQLLASPCVVENYIVAGDTSGTLTFFDPKKNRIAATLEFPERITTTSIYNPTTKTLFVPTYDNELFALRVVKK